MKKLLLILCCLALCGCASGVPKFGTEFTLGLPVLPPIRVGVAVTFEILEKEKTDAEIPAPATAETPAAGTDSGVAPVAPAGEGDK